MDIDNIYNGISIIQGGNNNYQPKIQESNFDHNQNLHFYFYYKYQ